MYTKWAKKQGYKGRVVEKRSSMNGGIKSATIEFEFKFAYGYLSGEMGVHNMIRGSQVGSSLHELWLTFLILSLTEHRSCLIILRKVRDIM